MSAVVDRSDADRSEADGVARLRTEGRMLRPWGNGPGERYDWHVHEYHKVLYCVAGSIVFHAPDGDLALEAGDRVEVGTGTRHAATVGPSGCRGVGGSA